MLELLTIHKAEPVAWAPWNGYGGWWGKQGPPDLPDSIPAVTVWTSRTLFTVALDSIRVEMRKTSARLYILNTASTGRKTRKGALCRLNSAGVATLSAAGVGIVVKS